MNWLRIAVGLFVAGLVMLFGLLAWWNRAGVPAQELAERIAASEPEWANYQEDIKSQIGAKPVAEWMGEPISVAIEGTVATVTFELEGPWALRDFGLPILLREPFGGIHLPASATVETSRIAYQFNLPQEFLTSPLPWVEIKYPHHERRLALDADGTWTAPETH